MVTGHRPNLTWRDLVKVLSRGAVVIAHLDRDHLAVAHRADDNFVYLADPSLPRLGISRARFLRDRFRRWGLVVSS